MNWDTFFDLGTNVTAEEARQFMSSGDPNRYQLLDVRQPGEYEHAHIPGSILIPLPELPNRSDEIDKEKPVIVYCRSGARSQAASQILKYAGIKHVFNMTGGILDWHGKKASGKDTAGLEFFLDGDFSSTFAMAYRMEAGLRLFYQILADREEKEEEKKMLLQMVRFEDGHMTRLKNKHKEYMHDLDKGEIDSHIMEGGDDINKMLAVFKDELDSPEQVLHLGMQFEAQAFDLYCRLAKKHQGTEYHQFYRNMANEEQQHLQQLARRLDTLLQN